MAPGEEQARPLVLGQRVYAVWAGNGKYYPGHVEALNEETGVVTVAWEDEGDDHKEVAADKVLPFEEYQGEATPWLMSKIDAAVEVRSIESKGRCLFTNEAKSPGDIIFVEAPICAALPSKHPAVWEAVNEVHKRQPLDLGAGWHFAAAVSMLELDEQGTKLALDKWAPDEEKVPCQDSLNVLSYFTERQVKGLEQVDPGLYQKMLVSWRYNAFAHGSESDGLVMYNRISMMAHSCSATCCWQYGPDDTFVLRSRVTLEPGAEITVSYLEEDDLIKGTDIRRQKLEMWRFWCACDRCQLEVDVTRGFACPKCMAGVCFVARTGSTERMIPCNVCYAPVRKEDQEELMGYEKQYYDVLEGIEKEDIPRIEEVRGCALQCFKQHWVVYQLEQWLIEKYRRDDQLLTEALLLAQRALGFLTETSPWASHTLASAYETVGELLLTSGPKPLRKERYREAASYFERGYRVMSAICGDEGDGALVLRSKWANAQQKG